MLSNLLVFKMYSGFLGESHYVAQKLELLLPQPPECTLTFDQRGQFVHEHFTFHSHLPLIRWPALPQPCQEYIFAILVDERISVEFQFALSLSSGSSFGLPFGVLGGLGYVTHSQMRRELRPSTLHALVCSAQPSFLCRQT